MNQLSWLIYLADICGSAGGWFVAFAWLAVLLVVIGSVIGLFSFDETVNDPAAKELRKICGKLLWVGWPMLIGFVLLSIVAPSRGTIMAIAASEVGEEILNSPTMGKATRALEAWIEAQLPDAPANNSPNNDGEGNN